MPKRRRKPERKGYICLCDQCIKKNPNGCKVKSRTTKSNHLRRQRALDKQRKHNQILAASRDTILSKRSFNTASHGESRDMQSTTVDDHVSDDASAMSDHQTDNDVFSDCKSSGDVSHAYTSYLYRVIRVIRLPGK